MALTHPGGGDLHEHGFGAHLRDVLTAGVAHAGAQATHHLVHDGMHRAFVGNPAFDAFGYEFFSAGTDVLKVAVTGALTVRHGTQ